MLDVVYDCLMFSSSIIAQFAHITEDKGVAFKRTDSGIHRCDIGVVGIHHHGVVLSMQELAAVVLRHIFADSSFRLLARDAKIFAYAYCGLNIL